MAWPWNAVTTWSILASALSNTSAELPGVMSPLTASSSELSMTGCLSLCTSAETLLTPRGRRARAVSAAAWADSCARTAGTNDLESHGAWSAQPRASRALKAILVVLSR